jgi:biotin-(acetyl-CoA carboxylase) ligase
VAGGQGTLEGLAEGIDAEGRLLIRTDSGQVQAVSSGDVTIIKNRVQ